MGIKVHTISVEYFTKVYPVLSGRGINDAVNIPLPSQKFNLILSMFVSLNPLQDYDYHSRES